MIDTSVPFLEHQKRKKSEKKRKNFSVKSENKNRIRLTPTRLFSNGNVRKLTRIWENKRYLNNLSS